MSPMCSWLVLLFAFDLARRYKAYQMQFDGIWSWADSKCNIFFATSAIPVKNTPTLQFWSPNHAKRSNIT